MGRKFGKVGATLDGSRRWRSLPDDSTRLTYTWLLWNRHGNPLGLYPLPPMYVAHSLQCDLVQAEERLEAMEKAGLIERAPGDIIRVCQWFSKQNPTRNPSVGVSSIKMLSDRSEIGDSLPRSKTALEFTYCALAGVGAWDTETKVYDQFVKAMQGFLANEVRRIPDMTLDAMQAMDLTPSDMVWNTMWAMVSRECEQDVYTLWDKREKREERENEREIETRDLRERPENETETETREVRPEKRAASGKKAAAGRGAGFQSIDDVQKALDRGEAGPAARRG